MVRSPTPTAAPSDADEAARIAREAITIAFGAPASVPTPEAKPATPTDAPKPATKPAAKPTVEDEAAALAKQAVALYRGCAAAA
jgi:hypothetical protein